MLTKVYILLYFHHHADAVIQSAVFIELARYMGPYSGRLLTDVIHPQIDNILNLDKEVEKSRKEEKSNLQPQRFPCIV